MYRTRTCGDLRLADEGLIVKLVGWVQKTRKMGGMTFVDLRDRYGITQLVFNQEVNAELCEQANKLGREFVKIGFSAQEISCLLKRYKKGTRKRRKPTYSGNYEKYRGTN